MPDVNQYDTQEEWMKVCIPQCLSEGDTQDQAVGKCEGIWKNKGAYKLTYAERQDLKDSDFVFSDERAFPVQTAQDVHDAVSSWGRYRGGKSFDEFKRKLIALARRKNLMSALPEEWKKGMMDTAAKMLEDGLSILDNAAVKVVGEWELDVNPVPFGSRSAGDSDGQWFDGSTDIMEHAFNTPLVTYQHGIKQGAKGLEGKPIVLGSSTPGTLHKQSDGWHVRVVLDKTKSLAKGVMEAAYKGMIAVSSDSINHLARLDTGDKLIPYEKNKPGRIAVWPLAGFSLWELGNGNFRPANRMAFALPAMKAIYREAGLPFPKLGSDAVLPEAVLAVKRARIENLKKQSFKNLDYIKNQGE